MEPILLFEGFHMKTSGVLMNFATQVRVELARRGWRQADLAEKAGMSLSSVSLKLNGQRSFRLDEAQAVAHALGMTFVELYERAERENEEPSAVAAAEGE